MINLNRSETEEYSHSAQSPARQATKYEGTSEYFRCPSAAAVTTHQWQ